MAIIEDNCTPRIIRAGTVGLRGAPGISAIGLLPPINFSYGDASPSPVLTLSVAMEIVSLSLQIEQVFNGAGASLALGVAGNPWQLFAADEVLLDMLTTFEFSPRVEYPAGTVLLLTIIPGGGATQGVGQLVITAVPTS